MSTTKTNSELLASIKQSNKTARETRAHKCGFPSSLSLIAYLEVEIATGNGNHNFITPVKSKIPATSTVVKKTKTVTETATGKIKVTLSHPIIHVADVLDASGSMHGPKFTAALKGINIGIKQLKEDTAAVKYTYTLCDFSDDVVFKEVRTSLNFLGTITGETRGSTALYDAIGETIERLKTRLQPEDKVLVNIYTDGQENSSRKHKGRDISLAIEDLSKKGWTFTFIGTDVDVKFVQSQLKFHASNTLVYDGTADGLEKSFVTNNLSRSAYSQKVSKGEDVSTGFYKDIK